MSLPLAFATRLDNHPGGGALFAGAGVADRPHDAIAWARGRGRGSASRGRARRPARRARRCRPRRWSRLTSRHGIEFHCLQKEILPDDRAWLDRSGRVTTHEAMLRDFGDTAALIEAMDLVITIDTAVAHLAGAMARPVWMLLAVQSGLALDVGPRRQPVVSDRAIVSPAESGRLGWGDTGGERSSTVLTYGPRGPARRPRPLSLARLERSAV